MSLTENVDLLVEQFKNAGQSRLRVKSPANCMSDFDHSDIAAALKERGIEAKVDL